MISVILVAISLSMDAFSLSICFGTFDLKYRKILFFSIIVGMFHFIMPLLGIILGDFLLKFIITDVKYITFILFFSLGLFMYFEKNSKKKEILINYISLILFAFMVSIDSFVAGIGINLISNSHILCCITFSVFSFIFTLLGLVIGRYVNNKIGNISKTIGAILLILISIAHLTK